MVKGRLKILCEVKDSNTVPSESTLSNNTGNVSKINVGFGLLKRHFVLNHVYRFKYLYYFRYIQIQERFALQGYCITMAQAHSKG